MTVPFQPLNQFVLVKFKDAEFERKTAGGIVMPGSAGTNFMNAKVVAVSEYVEIEGTTDRRRPRVNVGDEVVVLLVSPPMLPGFEIEMGSSTRLIQENEIVGVVGAL